MSISVHAVDFADGGSEALALLQANLPAVPHERRFRWLYRDNPDGPAWCWLARDKATGEAVGLTALFPRSMWIGDRVAMVGQVGDFAIAASHRSLGPALAMQRATMEPVDQGALAFCYDCPPHAAGMATFRRLGLQPSVAVHRYALPVRVDRQLERRLGFKPQFAAAAGNLLLRAYNRSRGGPANVQVEEHMGAFGDEFSHLDDSVRDASAIRSRRSAAHLNWRYREDPLNQYRVLTARRQGELIAFLIFAAGRESLTIVEVFGVGFPDSAIPLLQGALECAGPSCQSLEACFSDGNQAIAPFLKQRYRSREVVAQVVAYAAPGSGTALFLKDCTRWSLQGADIRA